MTKASLVVLLISLSPAIAIGQIRVETQLVAEADLPFAKSGKANGTLSFDGSQLFLATKAGLQVYETADLSQSRFLKEGSGLLHAWTDSQTGGLFVVEAEIPKDDDGNDLRTVVGFDGILSYFHEQADWENWQPTWSLNRSFGMTSPQWLPSLSVHAILETNASAGGFDEVESQCTIVDLKGEVKGMFKFPGRPIGIDSMRVGRSAEADHIFYMTKSGQEIHVKARPLQSEGSTKAQTVSTIDLLKLYGPSKQIVRPFTVAAPILATGEGTRKLRFRGFKPGDIRNFCVGLPSALPDLHMFRPLGQSTGIVSYFESPSNFLAEYYPGQLRSRIGTIKIQKAPNQPHSIIDVVEGERKILITTYGYIGGKQLGIFLHTVELNNSAGPYYPNNR